MSFIAAAVLAGGALSAGGSLLSGYLGSQAAKSASQAQLQAANNATNTQLGIFNQTQANLQPYNTAGQSALSQLAKLFGLGPGGSGQPNAGAATSALTQFPGYQFGLQQGNLAQQQSAASSGLLLSGAQLQASQQFGQNYAMQNAWNPYISQLNQISQLGESAGAQQGAIGANTGANVAQTQLAGGQAAASGIVGSSNAITGGINSGINSGLNSALLAYGLNNNAVNAYNNQAINTTGYNYGVPANSPYSTYPEV